jgi:hypothetical protein
LSRKCNMYIDTIPISFERKRAAVFSKEITWDIWQALLEAGAKGMTVKEILDKFRIDSANPRQPKYKYPKSTIYQALDAMEKIDCIESTTRAVLPWGHPPRGERARIGRDGGGRPMKVYTAAILNSPGNVIEENFYDKLLPVLERCVPEIKEKWFQLLDKILSEFESQDLKAFLPQDDIHEMCGYSHEGIEFLRAVSYGIIQFIEDQTEWENFARKHKIMR